MATPEATQTWTKNDIKKEIDTRLNIQDLSGPPLVTRIDLRGMVVLVDTPDLPPIS